MGRKKRGKKRINLLLKTYIGSLDLYTGFFLYQEVLDLKNKYGFISLKADLNLRHIKNVLQRIRSTSIVIFLSTLSSQIKRIVIGAKFSFN